MSQLETGKVLAGEERSLGEAVARWADQPVDLEVADPGPPADDRETTLAGEVVVTGPGTFFGRAQRTLRFVPTVERGWWFDRADIPYVMPIPVSVNSVWTTVRNIVLCSGSPHNYMRMVEHIVALRLGLGLDNVMIRMDSGDPPVFDRSSLELVEAVEREGLVRQARRAPHVTVKQPVTVVGRGGSFLTLLPAGPGDLGLFLDCAVDFRSAIGRQRVRFAVTPRTFREASFARTNTDLFTVAYCKTIGQVFADTRNLGYNRLNILIAGRWRYFNRPRLFHEGKSLEAVWHRAALDLLAALALIDRGRFAGTAISYKAGHSLDVRMVQELHQRELLVDVA